MFVRTEACTLYAHSAMCTCTWVCSFTWHAWRSVSVCLPQSKKGRSSASQREVTVVLPNGQYVTVHCDIKTRARDVFDMVVAHANLVEHFYFSLAFLDGEQSSPAAQLVADWMSEL